MKKKDLYDALSGIDEKYLSDSENFSEISVEFRRSKIKKISTIFSLCGCSLILVVALCLNSDVMENDFNNATEIIEKSDTVQTDISDSTDVPDNDIDISGIIMTTDDKTEIQHITENNSEISSYNFIPEENSDISDNNTMTNENPVESSERPITTNISAVIDNTDNPIIESVQTEIPTIETSEIPDVIPATDTIITTSDKTIDSYDKTDFSGVSVNEWLENSDVIWSETDTKGYLHSEYIPSGNTKISEELSDLMQNNSDDAVYAVMVDFSSCIDEKELLNWEYNGDTISDLKLKISEVTEYSENGYKYVGSDSIENIEYFLTSESEAKVKEIECRINEIKSAYRDAKIQEFRYSFNDNGLEIYSDRINGIQEENFCFYTFATQKHLKEFKCKNNEAFIFYPANCFN